MYVIIRGGGGGGGCGHMTRYDNVGWQKASHGPQAEIYAQASLLPFNKNCLGWGAGVGGGGGNVSSEGGTRRDDYCLFDS